tara:strand:- start:14348 stop:15814 length:1467 start_codon:yes stop_codon:yes gene_type:complete
MTDENKLILERKKKLKDSLEYQSTYPNSFRKTHYSRDLIEEFESKSKEDLESHSELFSISGRLLTIRLMGNSAFANLHDDLGKIQIYIQKKQVGEELYKLFNILDLGDIVGVEGSIFKTKTGELTLNVSKIILLSKSLRPLPEKFHGIADIEIKYRQRYLDLITDTQSKDVFIKRSKIVSQIREYFTENDYMEVETPMMHQIPGGANAKPFITHHNSLDIDLYLRIAPELFLKRCIIGGFERVFEINRSFRNEGLSIKHNPEFTMIEFYAAYQDFTYLMTFIENLFKSLTRTLKIDEPFEYQDHKFKLQDKFMRKTFHQSIIDEVSDINDTNIGDIEYLKSYCKDHKNKVASNNLDSLLLEIFEKEVEKKLIEPTFITHYPTSVSPLARSFDDNPSLCERFELFIAGREIANGFSELNDPEEQAKRFKDQIGVEDEKMKYDDDFIKALEYGMPPTAGAGIGIDRLVMLLTNSSSIRDVLLFPQMRPKK